jgi:NTP pyrophosphatase (non-canonical NTP hydrolase)
MDVGSYEDFVDGLLSKEATLASNTLGLAGEAGEVADLVKKHLSHGHALDKHKMCLELGDVLFYVVAVGAELGLTLDQIMCANVSKLRARYPHGFTTEASQNRTE